MNTRRALILLGLIGIAFIVIVNLGQTSKLAAALRGVQWYMLPLLIITQLASYWANAGFYQAFFRMTNRHVDFRKLYEISLAINFANSAIPAGGVAGTTFLAEAVRDEVPAGQATLAQIGRYIFTFLSYFAIMAVGFVSLFFGDNIGQLSVRLIVLIMLIILVLALILILLFTDRARLENIIRPLVATINWGGQKLLRRTRRHTLITPAKLKIFLDEFYEAYNELMSHRKYRLRLMWWGLASNIFEVLSVYAVFIGFGHWVNPGVVIAGYTFAVFASVVGFLTNGFGVYEAGMIATFTALGQPFSVAFAVVIVYRIGSLALFLPPGLVYYRKYLTTPATQTNQAA